MDDPNQSALDIGSLTAVPGSVLSPQDALSRLVQRQPQWFNGKPVGTTTPQAPMGWSDVMPTLAQGGRDIAKDYSNVTAPYVGPESTLGQVGGQMLSPVDSFINRAFGVNQHTAQSFGSGVPRMVASMLPGPETFIADSAVNRLGQSGSYKSAALDAGTNMATMGMGNVGGQFASGLAEGAEPAVQGLAQFGGAATAAGATMEVGRQAQLDAAGIKWNDHQRDPFTIENTVAQVFGGAFFGANDLVSHGINTVTGSTEWYNHPIYDQPKGLVSSESRPSQTFTPSVVNGLIAPKDDWREKFAKDGLDDIHSTTEGSQERFDKVNRLSSMMLATADVEKVQDTAEKAAKMVYAAPPTTPEGLIDLAKRVNTLKADALRVMDERNATGLEPMATSAAAYKQLIEQNYLKEEITYDWLKTKYGENVDRSLTGDHANAYLLLTQQLANHMMMTADAARQLRGQAKVDTPVSEDSAAELQRTNAFFDAVAKVPDKNLRDSLYERYKFHSGLDNTKDTGSTSAYMEDVTHIINHISKNEAVGWRYDEAPFMKRQSQQDEEGNEVRPAVSEGRNLDKYVAKDANDRYTLPVYKRSNRSQREILLGQSGSSEFHDDADENLLPGEAPPKIGGSLETGSSGHTELGLEIPSEDSKEEDLDESELAARAKAKLEGEQYEEPEVGVTKGIDAAGITAQLKDHLGKQTPESVWETISPEFTNNRGRIDPRTEARWKPMAKDLVQTILELGPTQQQGGNRDTISLSDSGKRILEALGGRTVRNSGRSDAGALVDKLSDLFDTSGRSFEKMRLGIVKRVLNDMGEGEGKVQSPGDAGAPVTPEGVVPGRPNVKGTGQTSFGISRTNDYNTDIAQTMRKQLMSIGLSPDEVEHSVRMGLVTAQNFKNPYLEATEALDPKSYNGQYSPPGNRDLLQQGASRFQALVELSTKLQNFKEGDPKELGLWKILSVHLHELVHDIQFTGAKWGFNNTDPTPQAIYSKERVAAWRQLNAASTKYTPEQKLGFLKTLTYATIPREIIHSGPGGTVHALLRQSWEYGSSTGQHSNAAPYEFVNELANIVGMGMTAGGNGIKLNPEEVFRHLPEEQALFAKAIYRDVHDNLYAFSKAIQDPANRGKWGMPTGTTETAAFQRAKKLGVQPNALDVVSPENYASHIIPLIDSVHKMVVSQEPQLSIHRANELMGSLSPGAAGNWTGPRLPAEPEDKTEPVEPGIAANVKAAFKNLQGMLFGNDPRKGVTPTAGKSGFDPNYTPPKGPKDPNQLRLPSNPDKPTSKTPVDIGWLWRNAPLFMQTLNHLTTRGIPLASDVMGAVKDIEPATTRLAMGALSPWMTSEGKFDPNNPTLKMKPGSVLRDSFNRVMDWQQRNKAQAFEAGKDGKFDITDKAKSNLGLTFARLNNEDRQTLIGAVHNVTATHAILGESLLQDRVDSAASRAARMIMALEPEKTYDRAKLAGTNIIRGLMLGDKGQPQLYTGLQDLAPTTRDAVLALANSGIVDGIKSMQTQFANNTWFASEQRPGTHLIYSNKDGVLHVDSAPDRASADAKAKKIQEQGFNEVRVVSKKDKSAKDFSAPESILHHYIDVERQAQEQYFTTNPNKLSPEVIAQLRAYAPTPGSGIEAMLETKGTNKFLIQRRDVPSALGLDYLDNMRDYISRLSSTIARTSIQRKVDLIHADSRLDGQDQFKDYVNQNIKSAMVPTGDIERSIRATASAYFIAGNLSSTVVIGSHGLQTLPETLVKYDTKGGWIGDAVGHLTTGIKDLSFLTSKGSQAERAMLVRAAQAKLDAGVPMTPTEMKVLAYKKAIDEKILDSGVFQNLTHDDDVRSMMARQFGVGDQIPEGKATLLMNGLYRLSKFGMGLHSFASGFNNKVGFLAGLNQAIDQGKPFNEAYQHADNVRVSALFGGGKANQPGYMRTQKEPGQGYGGLGGGTTTPVMRSMYTLQRYSTGFMGRYFEHASDVISNDPNLSTDQRVQAMKSFTTLFVTQLAMGGLLGLPGVAAALALLEKKGINATASVRQGVAYLAGAEEDNAGIRGQITETAMNGLPNQLFGVNIGPRLGVQDYMGTSAYDGYNLADLAGPTGSMVTNLLNGTTDILKGDTQKGITTLAPNFVKRPVDMAMTKLKYGDYGFRTPAGDKLYDPGVGDMLRYASGLNPSQLTERQNLKSLISKGGERYNQQQKQQLDEAGAALQRGDPSEAYKWARQQVGIGATTDPISAVRHVADHAAHMGQPEDPLSSVPLGYTGDALAIARTFPKADLPRRSELDSVRRQVHMEAKAGVPKADYSKDITRAAVVDALESKGMTKPQAERAAEGLGLK